LNIGLPTTEGLFWAHAGHAKVNDIYRSEALKYGKLLPILQIVRQRNFNNQLHEPDGRKMQLQNSQPEAILN
jgi:hypothetical protein